MSLLSVELTLLDDEYVSLINEFSYGIGGRHHTKQSFAKVCNVLYHEILANKLLILL